MSTITIVLIVIFCSLIGIAIGYAVRKYIAEGKINNAEELARKVLTDAEHNAETKKKELLVEAKEEIHKLRTEHDKEVKSRRNELQQLEQRVLSREESVDRKSISLEKKEEKLNSKLEEVKEKIEGADALIQERDLELQKVAGLTADEGKQILLSELEKEIVLESALIIKENEAKIKDESNKYASRKLHHLF